jgi:hypothetical protein
VSTPPPADAKVAFYAVLTYAVSLGEHQTLEYNKVVTNVGNAYDFRHGHFAYKRHTYQLDIIVYFINLRIIKVKQNIVSRHR